MNFVRNNQTSKRTINNITCHIQKKNIYTHMSVCGGRGEEKVGECITKVKKKSFWAYVFQSRLN